MSAYRDDLHVCHLCEHSSVDVLIVCLYLYNNQIYLSNNQRSIDEFEIITYNILIFKSKYIRTYFMNYYIEAHFRQFKRIKLYVNDVYISSSVWSIIEYTLANIKSEKARQSVVIIYNTQTRQSRLIYSVFICIVFYNQYEFYEEIL